MNGLRITAALRKGGAPTVRSVYLVPADRSPRTQFSLAIAAAISHVQRWYWEQMGKRKGFHLPSDVVEVIKLPHDSSWYCNHPLASDRTQWFWGNVLDDAFRTAGAGFHDPEHRWVFYIDAENEPDQAVGGNAGVALLPRHDLLGLIGQSIFPNELDVCRWVGGLGHELGHAFELPHPPGYQSPGSPGSPSLMGMGFRAYPHTFLNPEDIEALDKSRFFVSMDFGDAMPDCSDLLAAEPPTKSLRG